MSPSEHSVQPRKGFPAKHSVYSHSRAARGSGENAGFNSEGLGAESLCSGQALRWWQCWSVGEA